LKKLHYFGRLHLQATDWHEPYTAPGASPGHAAAAQCYASA